MSLSCKNCNGTKYVKNGFVHGNQRYLCKDCGYRFTDTPGHGYPIDMRYNAAILYICGISITCTAVLLGVAPSTVQSWLDWVATEYPPEPPPRGTVVVIELDEMWHFLNSKNEKLWIWKAINHDTGELIDWECGDRSEKTAALLIERLKKIGAKLYVADEYAVYANLIPIGKLYQGKDLTHGIERNNCRQRHWFARFHRRSIVVSKAKWMVDVTMALFARFRVNGTLRDLMRLVPLGRLVWAA
jgi:insertion element IS1 protein InsB